MPNSLTKGISTMKKYFALILTFVVILTCFAGCKPKVKDGAVVTDVAGKDYAAVTKEDGGIVRDEAGNLIVLVTDENGRNVKDDNGEYATNQVAIDHALQIGNRIEMPHYAITIPSGWETSEDNYSMVTFFKGGDSVQITTTDDKTLAGKRDQNHLLIRGMETQYTDSVIVNKAVTLKIGEANLESAYSAAQSYYLGFITYKYGGEVYSVMITSDRDMSGDIDDIVKILDSIEYAR